MKTRLLIALFLLGLAAGFAIVGTSLAAPVPKCPEGFYVRMSAANDGSFSCMPIKAAASSPAAASATTEKDNAQKRTAETIVAFSADHNIGKAKAGYRAALKLDPNYAPARYGLGLMLEAEEDWKGAREAFQQVVKNPKSGSFSAAAKAELADIEKTTNALKTPEGRKRLAYDDLIAQARLLLRSKQIPEAAKRAAEARKLDDGRWEAYMVAGEAMQAAGLMPEAIRFFNAAAKRAPGLYKVNLAGVARELQAAEEEIALWKKAESGNDKSAMETYLIRYPSGRHFAEASAMLKSINEREEGAKAERQRQQAVTATPSSTYREGMPAVGKAKCGACHAIDKKIVGPAFNDVAAKYKGDRETVSKLATNITKGGKLGWGLGSMPPKGLGANDAEIWIMAEFIASLANTATPSSSNQRNLAVGSTPNNTSKRTMTWANGDRYEGDFVNGQMTGKGIYTWANGNRYEGELANNRLTSGKEYSANGSIVAIYLNGQKHVVAERQQAVAPIGNYVSQGGLTWMPVTPKTMDWAEANRYCANTTIRDQSGWRLPTKDELLALYASGAMKGQGWSLLDTWSSMPVGSGGHHYVRLDFGSVGSAYGLIPCYVTCVR